MPSTVGVPICYAGSLDAAARGQRKWVWETFGAQVAGDSKISYFSRDVQTLPAMIAVSRLVGELRGVSVPGAERVLVLAPAGSTDVIAGQAKRNAAGKAEAKHGKPKRRRDTD